VLEEYDNEEEDEEEEEPTPLDPNLEGILDEFLATSKQQHKHEDGVSEDTKKVLYSAPRRKKNDIESEFEYLKIRQEPEFDCESLTSNIWIFFPSYTL
jgi:hypothetical protein